MKTMSRTFLLLVILGCVSGGGGESNPLLEEWTGPYGGVPPFDRVEVRHFEPALERAMAEARAEIDAIANQTTPPTFENTIEALERSGETFDRVSAVYSVWSTSMNSDEFGDVEQRMSPKLAAFSDAITQNEGLFGRVKSLHDRRGDYSGEKQRLIDLYYERMVRAGAHLDADARERLSAVNQDLATLYTRFSQNLLADEGSQILLLDSERDLAGLPSSLVDAAAAAAAGRGLEGKWVITNTRSSVAPFLTYSDRRDLRERAWRMFVSRGELGGETDNHATMGEILRLRAERAHLLGFETHAHWILQNTMAKTPERAMELMESVWTPAVARVHQEVADMERLAADSGTGVDIEPWDYRYYAEKVRKAKYDLDQNEIKGYLQLDQLREAMFWVAGELFGFSFREAPGVPGFHPDVEVWEVVDRRSGKHVGLWYFDPFAREGKSSGAWMEEYRTQEFFRGVTPIVSNNSNFIKGRPGEPVLISWDDAETLFHEFGHALHGLASRVHYPSLAGTNVAQDYVEFPSQILEHWLSTPEVLGRFATHFETGEPMPASLLEKIERASAFNQGFATLEYLASALVDMKLHLDRNLPIDTRRFEKEALAALGMPDEIVMRHRLPQFGHIFDSDSYAAGYYSYLWSDVLTADAFEAFLEGEGPYDRRVAKRLVDHVFAAGNTVDPAEGYRRFRGRDATSDALMRKRGFSGSEAPVAENIAKGMHLLRGRFVEGRQPDGNSIIIEGRRGLVAIDTGRHPEHTERILVFADEMNRPIRAVINTHWHLDHVGGNVMLRREDPQLDVYATGAIEAALDGGFLANYRSQLLQYIPTLEDAEQKAAMKRELALIDSGNELKPTTVVESSGRYDVAGRELVVHIENHAVTAADLWVHDPATGVVIAGDLVTLPVPFLDTACTGRWIESLDRVLEEDFTMLVPGHGEPMNHEEVRSYRNALSNLVACGASDRSDESCADGWISDLGSLLPGSEHQFARRLLVTYYVPNLVRKQNPALCQ